MIMRKDIARYGKWLLSPWLIVVFLALGWGPLFIAEYISETEPDLRANYVPQAFAMRWISVTVLSSLLAVISLAIQLVRFVVGWLSK
jgi:hypothetical protein